MYVLVNGEIIGAEDALVLRMRRIAPCALSGFSAPRLTLSWADGKR